MKAKRIALLTASGAVAAGSAALVSSAFRKDMKAAKERLQSLNPQTIETPEGPIEYAIAGEGPAVLMIHGAGGGFDQGLDLAAGLVGDGYRVIAPSRFGYLGTPLPPDASPEAQAEAHLRLLDALHVDTAMVMAVSAGGPSAIQVCLKHPDRCSALVLAVALAYSPEKGLANRRFSPIFEKLWTKFGTSDAFFWAGIRVAHSTFVRTILGTPVEDYEAATAEERADADRLLRNILPVSRRAAGLANETFVATTLAPIPIHEMRVPTLVITVENCLYGTHECGSYVAHEIPNARHVTFARGGHLFLGHTAAVRSEVREFLKECAEKTLTPA